MNEVTRIINAIEQGDSGATEKLLPLVYEELRLLAAQKMSQEKPGQTLQATALVHEAYLRLVGSEGKGWDNRGHFFAAAAEAMRRILVDRARKKKTLRHGSGRRHVDVEQCQLVAPMSAQPEDLLTLNEAIIKLEETDASKAKESN